MPRLDQTRNERFQAFRAARPSLTLVEIAEYLGRSMKTVHMWNVGYPGSIPMDTLRLIELAFPVREDADLIG